MEEVKEDTVTITIPVTPEQTTASDLPTQTVNTQQEEVKPIENVIQNDTATAPVQPQEVKEKVKEGRPCEYCENKDFIMKLTRDYIEYCDKGVNGKPVIPYIEELAIKLKHHRETILEWSKNIAEHPEFSEAYKMIETYQRFRLLQRTLGRFNPSGAIFQLKVNHGMIETEKKLLAGDSKEPLIIEIVDEKKNE